MDMKETFGQLRRLAKAKRDQDIQDAKQAYKDRLAQIDALQRDLGPPIQTAPKRRNRNGELRDAVLAAIPDEPFKFDDVMASLRKLRFTLRFPSFRTCK